MEERPRHTDTPEAGPSPDSSVRPGSTADAENRRDAGITNRPLEREREEQESVPPRGQRKDADSHA